MELAPDQVKDKHTDYLFVAKRNQHRPGSGHLGSRARRIPPPAEIREKGRGRIAHRVLRTRTALNTSLAVPPVPPAFPLERTTTVVKIGEIRSAI
ncbi:MAG: hypothetical protein M1294_05845, partial [Firmicutes bacterium]|nr:hypothetical protein [Bacillota bacterium]